MKLYIYHIIIVFKLGLLQHQNKNFRNLHISKGFKKNLYHRFSIFLTFTDVDEQVKQQNIQYSLEKFNWFLTAWCSCVLVFPRANNIGYSTSRYCYSNYEKQTMIFFVRFLCTRLQPIDLHRRKSFFSSCVLSSINVIFFFYF